MTRAQLGLGLAVLTVTALIAPVCKGAEPSTLPVLLTDKLQEPPMQEAAWTPPKADVPEDVIAATTRLFQQGLADPRGCEYRSISVGTGSCWSGDGGVVQCHGWVLPATEKGSQQFAVCWNGLIYPALKVGDKADLKADIDAVIKADEDARAATAKDNPDFPFMRWRSGCPSEGESTSQSAMLPLKVSLLLRLGESDLAGRYWKCWTGPAAKEGERVDFYIELAEALKWSAFDRAVCAHMRGDDHLAVLSAQQAMTIKEQIDKDPTAKKNDALDGGRGDYADVLPALIEDDKRRIKQPPVADAIKRGQSAYPSKAGWVAALIANLEEVKHGNTASRAESTSGLTQL